ncbi:MAG: hypothetical protein Q8P41_10450 [Pseudomonadota bacterium]|nr:hypothetical protein [Pseudomonadota bacterium]
MHRAERRKVLLEGRRDFAFDPEQLRIEGSPRGRLARRIRGHLRRLEPIAMLTPRWSAPQSFLEDLALDLAVGEPEIGCRTVSFRPLMGRTAPEAWNFLLRVIGELGGGEWGTHGVPMVCDRRGFFNAAAMLLDQAQEDAPYPIALLAHGAEHLPVEVLDDIAQVWSRYAEQVEHDRRCTILLAGSVDTPALDVGGSSRIDLTDFGELEAADSLVLQLGVVDPQELERAARFSGGVPAIVAALAIGAQRGFPNSPTEYLRAMGPIAHEIRGAVQSALTAPDTADRLQMLLDGEPQLEDADVDPALLFSGVIRRVRRPGGPHVALRSPAIAAAAG